MATSASVSKGTILKIKSGTTFVAVAELKDFSGLGGGSAAILDATHLGSNSKEKLPGVKDEGSLKFTFNYIEADPGQLAMLKARDDNTVTDFELTIGGTKVKAALSGFVQTAEIMGGVDKINELSVSVEITGSVVRSVTA
ncbi:phage tail tube protein [Sphingomonas sp. NFX23]|uniref:phage tail tube protein n=1 Tax=Sphingomonas sp. NFX23 TaxID=2819532 RepID=UPI003CF15048